MALIQMVLFYAIYFCFKIVIHRENPRVKEVDMLHANDYGNMNLNQLKTSVSMSEDVEKNLRENLKYVLRNLKCSHKNVMLSQSERMLF